jgi:hypothetical protein
MVLLRQLNRGLDRLFVVTHRKEDCYRARRLEASGTPYQLEQQFLCALFGEAHERGDSNVYCFLEVNGQSLLSPTKRKYVDIVLETKAIVQIANENDFAS